MLLGGIFDIENINGETEFTRMMTFWIFIKSFPQTFKFLMMSTLKIITLSDEFVYFQTIFYLNFQGHIIVL